VSTEQVDVDFFDPATQKCPFPAHDTLRNEAPVWQDPTTKFYVITRYDDVRSAILDPKLFTNQVALSNARTAIHDEESPEAVGKLAEAAQLEDLVKRMYEEQGWTPASNLDAMDEPEHMQLRKLFDYAFRPAKVSELDPFVEKLAYDLVDKALENGGSCEYIAEIAIPLPLYTIGRQLGIPEVDMPQIKAWTDAWVQRMGLAQTAEERVWSTKMEIEAQQYLQPIFDRLREQPDDTLLSTIVNKPVDAWGRTLTNEELHSEVIVDLLVGGSETTTNALSSGVRLLIEQPDVWKQLKANPERYLDTFIEEVIRLEGPVQALTRQVSDDVVLHGVTIPKGSLVLLLYGAANRDPRHYKQADCVDLERRRPRGHLGFGTGTHVCLGAALARREMHYGFSALLDRVDELSFQEGANDFAYQPNYFFRGLTALHVELRANGV